MNEESEVKVHQGRNIRLFRNAKDMKQEIFAEMMGVNQSVVARLEQQCIIEDATLEKCANILGVSVEMIKEFDREKMFNGFTCNIDKIENANGAIFSSRESSTTTNNYPIEKMMELNQQISELNQKNAELYERMLQAEKEKNAFLEKMLAEKGKAE